MNKIKRFYDKAYWYFQKHDDEASYLVLVVTVMCVVLTIMEFDGYYRG